MFLFSEKGGMGRGAGAMTVVREDAWMGSRADKGRKRLKIKERRDRVEEKKRLEEMQAKMSAKKLQRLRKVCLGLTVIMGYWLMGFSSGRDDLRKLRDRDQLDRTVRL